MLGQLRSFLKPLFSLLAKPLVALKISPMWVTLLGVPFAVACAHAYARQDWGWALGLLVLATIWDAVDGTVARGQGKSSLWGNYFETMIDKLVEIIIFIGLAVVVPLAAIAALGFGLWSSYAKPRVGLVIITDNRDWPAIGEHADKLMILFVATLRAVLDPSNGPKLIEYGLWVIALVSFIGALQRMHYAHGLILEAQKKGTVLPYLKKG